MGSGTPADGQTPGHHGRYRLGPVIGAGGMGTVLFATDELLGRPVALKLLRDDLVDDPRALARFRQEARISASLSHPGIAAVYDFAEQDGRQAIVMELLDGQDLHTTLQHDGPMEPAAAAGILAEAADALNYAHSLGAVHRDIKPANIFLTTSGVVKLTDFGVAYAGGMDQLTATGMVVGTADYLSPEQVRGEPSTPASDVYSLGAVAFELLTGRPPFRGDNPIAVATARLGAAAPSPQAENPLVPPALDAVVRQALDPLPILRFSSAGVMAGALRAAVAPAPGHAPMPVQPPGKGPAQKLGNAPVPVRDASPTVALGGDGRTRSIAASPATMVEIPGLPVLQGAADPLGPPMDPAVASATLAGSTGPAEPGFAGPALVGSSGVMGFTGVMGSTGVAGGEPGVPGVGAPRRGPRDKPPGAAGRRRRRWLWGTLIVLAMAGLSLDIVGTWVQAMRPKPVPAMTGFTYDAAASEAQGLGFTVVRVPESSELPANQVLGTNPEAGAHLKRGGRVTIDVSLGNEFAVDNVTSRSVNVAEAMLQGQGLTPVVSSQTVPGTTAGLVQVQDPAAPAAVTRGQTVTLTVTAVPQPSPAAGPGGLLGPLFSLFGPGTPTPKAPKHHGGGG